ncbi:RNA polymerase factor sigma-54 [Sphingomonas qomolangmaensis]|uniref:RNA polymerase sigma-54 factor n=1 Tax=Sphingomonas qomolangmaensis TaxID=2918765 RepID=A0ABY5LB63_9SPHN|nr:RNA polymerase factor sigma-54 [Sphingomonas qomolangmaensis]UUL82964.1 RNA polymerase factor sigma-54 [Sphingomonas qomolangmaensis]
MNLAPRLDIRQSQSLVMTPQLQQAIKLLALSNLEVEGFIAEELERNPLLESAGGEDGDGGEPIVAVPVGGDPVPADELPAGGSDADPVFDGELALANVTDDSAADSIGSLDGGLGLNGVSGGGGVGEDGLDFDSFAGGELSLADHLMAQAGTAVAGADLFIAAHLIDQIDECGYLTASLLDVANRLGVALARVEAVLGVIQTFDPTGVGARNLSECLALQAKEADRYDPCMARLIDNLDLVARGQLAQLKRMCGVDDEDMADMIRELRSYDPKPGCRYGGEPSQAVVPDLFVARRGAGWAVEINAATLPRVLVNRAYYVELSGGSHDKASKTWLADCLTSANWLVKALDQRQRTIIKVASEIVKQQEAFFLHGVAHLRPLTLARVAEAIEMHESTVSRVTSNKYLSCARGLFELKFFFTSAIQSADGGEAVSAQAVKAAIRALIAGEGAKILSDDTLVELLNARGFDIARRTVAKYREALGIGSSVQRRRAKALEG